MSCEQMMYAMSFVLSREELERIVRCMMKDGKIYLEVDLHGMTRGKAGKFIKNIININRGDFILDIIHGYNNGIVLKKMLIGNEFNERVVDRRSPGWNPGQTRFVIAA